MVWLCKFRSVINDWDLKILYMDLESWKNGWKKIKWNEIGCMIRKVKKNEKIKWNGTGKMR